MIGVRGWFVREHTATLVGESAPVHPELDKGPISVPPGRINYLNGQRRNSERLRVAPSCGRRCHEFGCMGCGARPAAPTPNSTTNTVDGHRGVLGWGLECGETATESGLR